MSRKGKLILAIFLLCLLVGGGSLLSSRAKQDPSLLNYKNLATLAYQANTVEIRHGLDNCANSLTGISLGQFLADANWRKKFVSSPLELAADITICFSEDLELRFYESEPKLAMVLNDSQWQYYHMNNTTYADIVAWLTTIEEP